MENYKISNVEQKQIPIKSQVQIKNNNYSRNFTVHGLDVDYLFSLYHMITQKLIESPTDSLRIVCYKPPQNNLIGAENGRRS